MRALSCLNLLLFHFTFVYQNKYGFASPLGFSFPYGKYGVQLFFMLSGLGQCYDTTEQKKAWGIHRCPLHQNSAVLLVSDRLKRLAIRAYPNVPHRRQRLI